MEPSLLFLSITKNLCALVALRCTESAADRYIHHGCRKNGGLAAWHTPQKGCRFSRSWLLCAPSPRARGMYMHIFTYMCNTGTQTRRLAGNFSLVSIFDYKGEKGFSIYSCVPRYVYVGIVAGIACACGCSLCLSYP